MSFHPRSGHAVTFLNAGRTARRDFSEFCCGLVFSAEPLVDDIMFEVSFDKKAPSWTGTLAIGVTTLDPSSSELPPCAIEIRNSAWLLTGNVVTKDGKPIVQQYGPLSLNSLGVDDRLGVIRTSKDELLFFYNGHCLGVAARSLPKPLFVVVDIYGQCTQVTIVSPANQPLNNELQQIDEDGMNQSDMTASEFEGGALHLNELFALDEDIEESTHGPPVASSSAVQDFLRFHPRCGKLVKLSMNNKMAERDRPLDDYNNGVVMTHRPLYRDEMFQIRVDSLIDKWSGKIEVGVTTHNPATIVFPSTMTLMDSGTIMMSGCKILVNGLGTYVEYGTINLDDLKEGDTVGMMVKSSGWLHYFINGIDQGGARDHVNQQVWGVIDLYGKTVKVSVVDPSGNSLLTPIPPQTTTEEEELEGAVGGVPVPVVEDDAISFQPMLDSSIVIINNGKTAHRPNAFEQFGSGVVITNRLLKPNEMFQVRIDLVVQKWEGSIVIGIVQQATNQTENTSSNDEFDSCVIVGEDFVRNSVVAIPHYVNNFDKLTEGDRIGVMKKDNGGLHFFLNDVDLGAASYDIQDNVFGIVDLYGKVAQATIVESQLTPTVLSPSSSLELDSPNPDLCFNVKHGHNAKLTHHRMTATRVTPNTEFNHAVLFSSRPLRECEMFEIVITRKIDCWIGNLEMGITAINPEHLEANGLFSPGTATDLSWDTYILSGSSIMRNGECVRNGYYLDLDTVVEGNRIGIMWHADNSLHYYLDGIDQGKALQVPFLEMFAVVDLYGQCVEVTLQEIVGHTFNKLVDTIGFDNFLSVTADSSTPPNLYWFSEYCGTNVALTNGYCCAHAIKPEPTSSLAFSGSHLPFGEMFEVQLKFIKTEYAGNMCVGITDLDILNAYVNTNFPRNISMLPHYTAYINGGRLIYSNVVKGAERKIVSVDPSFEWLRNGDKIGFKKVGNRKVQIFINSILLDVAFENVPDKVYFVIDLHGCTTVSASIDYWFYKDKSTEDENLLSPILMSALPVCIKRMISHYTFHYVHGQNIKLYSSDTVAVRESGFNHGLVIISEPLTKGKQIMLRLDNVDDNWSGTFALGALKNLEDLDVLPDSGINLKGSCWMLTSDGRNICGDVTRSRDGEVLLKGKKNSIVTLYFMKNSSLVVMLDDEKVTEIAKIPVHYSAIHPVIDLYGAVQQISILLHPYKISPTSSMDMCALKRVIALKDAPQEYDPIMQKRSTSYGELYEQMQIERNYHEQPSVELDDANLNYVPVNRVNSYGTDLSPDTLSESSSNKDDEDTGEFFVPSFEIDKALIHYFKSILPQSLVVIKKKEEESEDSKNGEDGKKNDDGKKNEDGNNTEESDDEGEKVKVIIDSVLQQQVIEVVEEIILDTEFQTKGAVCDYVRLASLYWKHGIAYNDILQNIMSKAKVHCYCSNCNSTATRLAGWVCVELVPVEQLPGKTMFLNADKNLIEQLYLAVALPLPQAPRPTSAFRSTPRRAARGCNIWEDPDGEQYTVSVSIEVHIQDAGDTLTSISIHLQKMFEDPNEIA